MDGEVYADFVLLWLLCHQSRVEAERPEECWLEKWSHAAAQQGTRALEGLRDGVDPGLAHEDFDPNEWLDVLSCCLISKPVTRRAGMSMLRQRATIVRARPRGVVFGVATAEDLGRVVAVAPGCDLRAVAEDPLDAFGDGFAFVLGLLRRCCGRHRSRLGMAASARRYRWRASGERYSISGARDHVGPRAEREHEFGRDRNGPAGLRRGGDDAIAANLRAEAEVDGFERPNRTVGRVVGDINVDRGPLFDGLKIDQIRQIPDALLLGQFGRLASVMTHGDQQRAEHQADDHRDVTQNAGVHANSFGRCILIAPPAGFAPDRGPVEGPAGRRSR